MKKFFSLWLAILAMAFFGVSPNTAIASESACCVDSVGDVNLDGVLTMDDAAALMAWLNCVDSNICMDAADWDGDGDIDQDDADSLGKWLDGGDTIPRPTCHSYSACNTVINSQPTDTMVVANAEPLVLTVDVTSNCELYYRWYKNDTLLTFNCDWDTLNLEVVAESDGGVYYVEVLTVDDRVLTDSFTVTVIGATFTPDAYYACHPASDTVGISIGSNPPVAISATVSSSNPGVATFTGDQTGGTVTTVSVGGTELVATYLSYTLGTMSILSGSISTDAATPEYMCVNDPMKVINVTVSPSGGFTYTNSDPGVVSLNPTFSTLEVTPVGTGSSTVDLMIWGDSAICESFTVEVKELSPSRDTLYFCLGDTVKYVDVTVGPDTLNWTLTNSNSGVATATIVGSQVRVASVSGGFTTVTLYAAGGTISCGSFVVQVTDLRGIAVTSDHVSMCANSGPDTVGVVVTPSDSWFLANSAPGVVDAQQITGDQVELTPVGPGYATILLYANGLSTVPCGEFTVSVFDISVSGPDPDSVCLDSADVHSISILPAADFDSVTVTSSNPGVVTATLSSATTIDMFGVSEGSATVHLAYAGDTCASYVVEVEDCVKCLDIDLMQLCADYVYSQGGDNYMLVGNVTIDSVLWFDDTVYINTSTGLLTGDGEIEIRDIPVPVGPPAIFVLWNGPISATLSDTTISELLNPMVALTVGFLGIEIDNIILIPDGILIEGSIVLPSIFGVNAEINSLELTTTAGVQITGRIDYAGPLGMKGLQVKDIWLEFDTPSDTYAAGATMEIKQVVEIGGDVEIVSGQLNRIGLSIAVSPGIAIDATGLSLVGGSGTVDHMADPEPILIAVTVDITGGPSIADVDLIKFEAVGVTVQPPRYFGVGGSFLVFDIQVGQAEAAYEPPKFSLSFSVNFIDVIKGGFNASLTGTQVAGSAYATIGTPCDLPGWLAFIRCKEFGGAELDFNNSRIKGRVWVRIRIKIWPFPAFHINLEGAFKLEYSSSGIHFYLGTNYNSLAKIFKKSDRADQYTAGFAIPEHTENALFMVKGESGPVPSFQLIRPDSSVADSTSIGFVRMDDDSVAFYVVENPEAGLWTVDVPDDGGQVLDAAVLAENTRPAIAFTSPSGTQTDGGISWHDHDPDDNAEIRLYIDSDNKDFDGFPINLTPIAENDPTDSYTWDMLNVDPGDYYVYGVIEDTMNAPYRVYAPGKIHIPNTLGPGAPGALTPTLTDTSVWLSWTPSPDPVLGYEVRYTDDLTSSSYDNHWTVGDTNNIEIIGMATGRMYRMAIRCFDSLNNISETTPPIYVSIYNSSANNPPVLTQTGVTNFAQVGQLYMYVPDGTDMDPSDVLTFALDSVPSGFTHIPAPPPNPGHFEWTPDSTQVGMYWIQLRLLDGAGGEDTLGYILHVVEADRSYGNVEWGSPVYGGIADPGFIVLQDYDLDVSEYAIDSTTVLVTSDTDPVGITVWLKQISATSMDFIGTVEFSDVGSGPGVIYVSDSDEVRVRYDDDEPIDSLIDATLWLTVLTCCNEDGIRGDLNYDGNLNVADLTYAVDYLFRGGPAPPCDDEADLDGTGQFNVADLTYIVDYLFRGGPPPVACP